MLTLRKLAFHPGQVTLPVVLVDAAWKAADASRAQIGTLENDTIALSANLTSTNESAQYYGQLDYSLSNWLLDQFGSMVQATINKVERKKHSVGLQLAVKLVPDISDSVSLFLMLKCTGGLRDGQMNQVEAQSRDGLWVLLKLERLKAQTLGAGLDEEKAEYTSTSVGGYRLTVRADDKMDPSRLISLFRAEIERTRGAFPGAMQPFYVYGVVAFEWQDRKQSDDDSLLSSLKELVTKSDLKRSVVAPQ